MDIKNSSFIETQRFRIKKIFDISLRILKQIAARQRESHFLEPNANPRMHFRIYAEYPNYMPDIFAFLPILFHKEKFMGI